MKARVLVGISGWRYAPWRGTFFPAGLRQRDELRFAAEKVATIEINGTFYSLQRAASFRAWERETPPGFVFAVKGPKYITHFKRLRDVDTALANFFASGVLRLGRKLGPFLWQLPPRLAFDPERVGRFLDLLPRTTREAVRLARRHDSRVREPEFEIDRDSPLRHALEVRHPSFETPAYLSLLRERRVANVVADTAGRWPAIDAVTCDFAYVRLHGDKELYASGYSPGALRKWAKRIATWQKQTRGGKPLDVYIYFDNDIKTHAPFDAMALNRLLNPVHTRRSRATSRKTDTAPPIENRER